MRRTLAALAAAAASALALSPAARAQTCPSLPYSALHPGWSMVGDRIGLHPMAVIFSVMAGGTLFGFLGMLLALPVAAVANVLLRFAHERYTQSRLYAGAHPHIVLDGFVGDAPPPAPPADGMPPAA